MTPRSLALVLGLACLGLGALGLMPGALAGLLPVDPPLALIHFAIGAWSLAVYAGLNAAERRHDTHERGKASAAA